MRERRGSGRRGGGASAGDAGIGGLERGAGAIGEVAFAGFRPDLVQQLFRLDVGDLAAEVGDGAGVIALEAGEPAEVEDGGGMPGVMDEGLLKNLQGFGAAALEEIGPAEAAEEVGIAGFDVEGGEVVLFGVGVAGLLIGEDGEVVVGEDRAGVEFEQVFAESGGVRGVIVPQGLFDLQFEVFDLELSVGERELGVGSRGGAAGGGSGGGVRAGPMREGRRDFAEAVADGSGRTGAAHQQQGSEAGEEEEADQSRGHRVGAESGGERAGVERAVFSAGGAAVSRGAGAG